VDYQIYNWQNERFLIADDDLYSALLLEKMLSKTGAQVTIAKDGLEALEKINEDPSISIAILDIIMPNLNGYEVVEYAKKVRPDLIFIACTADVIRLNLENCLKIGFIACIPKPFLPIRLFGILEKALILREQ
jgi:CheY-like chemotaxis protein